MDDTDSAGQAVYLSAPTLRELQDIHETRFGGDAGSIPLYVTVSRAIEALEE